MEEIRKALGRNIIVADGLSVGVAWTSVCLSHEPPPPLPPEEESLSPPATPARGQHDGTRGEGIGSPGGYTDAATDVDGHVRRQQRTRGEATKRGSGGGKKGGKKRSVRQKAQSRRKGRKRGGGDRGGGQSDGGGDSDGSGGGGRAEEEIRGRQSGQNKATRGAGRQQRRPKSTGALPTRRRVPRRGARDRGAATGQSSGEEVRSFVTLVVRANLIGLSCCARTHGGERENTAISLNLSFVCMCQGPNPNASMLHPGITRRHFSYSTNRRCVIHSLSITGVYS